MQLQYNYYSEESPLESTCFMPRKIWAISCKMERECVWGQTKYLWPNISVQGMLILKSHGVQTYPGHKVVDLMIHHSKSQTVQKPHFCHGCQATNTETPHMWQHFGRHLARANRLAAEVIQERIGSSLRWGLGHAGRGQFTLRFCFTFPSLNTAPPSCLT